MLSLVETETETERQREGDNKNLRFRKKLGARCGFCWSFWSKRRFLKAAEGKRQQAEGF